MYPSAPTIKFFQFLIILLSSYMLIQCQSTKGNKPCKIEVVQQGIMDTLPASIELIDAGNILLLGTFDSIYLNSKNTKQWISAGTYYVMDKNKKCVGDTLAISSGALLNIYIK